MIFLLITLLLNPVHSSSFVKSIDYVSKIDKFEIENFKYQIDLDTNLRPLSQISDSKLIPIRTVNGQLYVCSLSDDTLNYSDDDDEIDNREENSLLSLFMSQNLQDSQKNLNQNHINFNFTLIGEKVKAYMTDLNNSNICIYKNNGWWTYEYCFGKHINQYHVMVNGSIQGEKISLGNFSRDFDWLSGKKYPILNDILYHEQYYDMGSMCELTGKPRRATVKIFCDETSLNQIEAINEIETCVYEIYIKSYTVCSVPNFKKQQNNYDINCSPVVSQHVYEKYQQKLNEKKPLDDKQQDLLNDIKQLEDINSEMQQDLTEGKQTIDNFLKLSEPNNDPETTKAIDDLLKLTENVLKDGKKDDEIVKSDAELKQETDEKRKAIEEFLKLTQNILNKKDVESKVDDLETDLKTTEKKIEDLVKITEDLKDADKFDQSSETTSKEMSKTEELFDKIEAKLSSILTNMEADPLGEGFNQREEKVSIMSESTDFLKDIDELDVKKLEKRLVDKLSKSDRLASTLKTNKIKIKIVKIDPNNVFGTNSFNSLASSLFETSKDKEKIQQLNKNYNFVYSEDVEGDNDDGDNNVQDDDNLVDQDKLILF